MNATSIRYMTRDLTDMPWNLVVNYPNMDVSRHHAYLIDRLIGHLTAFKNLDDLIHAGGNYRPSLNVSDKELGKTFWHIAEAYDLAMQRLNDPRRAFRF